MELAALEYLKNSPKTCNGSYVVNTLVLSFLDGSSLFLQASRTTIKALMSLTFCQYISPTTELAALEHFKNECKSCEHSSTFIFDWILFILAGNNDSYKCLDGFEIQLGRTWVYEASCH